MKVAHTVFIAGLLITLSACAPRMNTSDAGSQPSVNQPATANGDTNSGGTPSQGFSVGAGGSSATASGMKMKIVVAPPSSGSLMTGNGMRMVLHQH